MNDDHDYTIPDYFSTLLRGASKALARGVARRAARRGFPFDRIEQAAQDVDLVALELGAPEKSAQLGQQPSRSLRIEKTAADHDPFEVQIEALDVLVRRWRRGKRDGAGDTGGWPSKAARRSCWPMR